MKICQPHWDAMRAKLDQLGIGHIGARTGQEAVGAMQNQLERAQAGESSEPTNDEWDPLMTMNFAFMSRALEIMGLAAMAPDFGCPLCSARADFDLHSKPGGCGDPECDRPQTSGEPTDEAWIRGCAEAQRDEAHRRGLVHPS